MTKIELVVTLNELLDIERIAAKVHETIDIKQWSENDGKYEYLIIVSKTLFDIFVAHRLDIKKKEERMNKDRATRITRIIIRILYSLIRLIRTEKQDR